MKCEASDEFTTSTAWILLEYSCPTRWNTRSAPLLSTRTATPGYFASKALPTFSATGRSTAVYQTTLPSFFAASISFWSIADAVGACARIGEAKVLAAAKAVVPCRICRRENFHLFIDISPCWFAFLLFDFLGAGISSHQRTAILRRQFQPHRRALRNAFPGGGDDA